MFYLLSVAPWRMARVWAVFGAITLVGLTTACNKSSDLSGDTNRKKNNGTGAEANPSTTTDTTTSNPPTTPKTEISDPSTFTAPETPQTPREGCQAFFTGLLAADRMIYPAYSQIYTVDKSSEWVGAGRYPFSINAFPKSVAATFDGIAFDKGTRVTIYEKPNFTGRVLYTKEGPAVLNNVIFRNPPSADTSGKPSYREIVEGPWQEPLQSKFPQSVREWSDGDMHQWSYGSVVVECL